MPAQWLCHPYLASAAQSVAVLSLVEPGRLSGALQTSSSNSIVYVSAGLPTAGGSCNAIHSLKFMQDQTVLLRCSTISLVMLPAGLQRASGSLNGIQPQSEATSDVAEDTQQNQPLHMLACREPVAAAMAYGLNLKQ